MQPIFEAQFLPTLDWWLQCATCKEVQVSSLINLQCKPKPNQYLIGGPNAIQTLSIPLNAHSITENLMEWKINYDHKWRQEHKNALQTAYGKSPFFEFYDYRYFAILDKELIYFRDLLEEVFYFLCDALKMEKELIWVQQKPEQFGKVNEIVYPYYQVFETKFGFRQGLCTLDLLSNLGPMAQERLW